MAQEHHHGTGQPSPFEELIKLQNTFQQSLSQATMNYLRKLQNLVGPVTPGTVVQQIDQGALGLTLAPGGKASATIKAENRQRVHTMVTPMLSPLTSDTGTTWFPEAVFTPPMALLATDETQEYELLLLAPKDIPKGIYRGAVLLYGCADGVIPVEVTVRTKAPAKSAKAAGAASTSQKKTAPRKTKASTGKRKPARKPARKT